MLLPPWFGRRYPSPEDLEDWATEMGCTVGATRFGKGGFIAAGQGEPPVILVPDLNGPLAWSWALAHELGHLSQHEGPKGELAWSRDEAQANRWAARALIPEAAVRRHGNASEDAFMAALSRHYEDLPLHPCTERRLAARIARIRLGCFETQLPEAQ